MIGFNFAQAFMITAVLVYMEDLITPESGNRGYGLIGAAFLIYCGLAVVIICPFAILLTSFTANQNNSYLMCTTDIASPQRALCSMEK